MNKTLVMRAIYHEAEWIYEKVICNPKNDGKDLSKYKEDIKDLYEAYFELRGHKGTVVFVQGVDDQANDMKSFYELSR